MASQIIQSSKVELMNLIVERYGPVLKNKDAAAVLKIPNWKLSKIPREELPRSFGRGRGGVKILANHLVDYIIRNTDFGSAGDATIKAS